MKLLNLLLLLVTASSCQTKQDLNADKLYLKNGDKNILTYNAGVIPSQIKDKPYYSRSGYIHPFKTPSGLTVTGDFPADHPHHHAIMFAWTSAKINGKKVDFWNQQREQAKIEHVKTVAVGKDKIIVTLRHINLTGKEPETILNETWEIERYNIKGANAFTLKSTQTIANKKPFEITKYHYGAMCIRASNQWMKEFSVTTSEGKNRTNGNHSRPTWVTMNGKVDGKLCGLAAMGHPTNFRFPQPVRLHPKMPYFCFAPMVLSGFKIQPKDKYVSRFLFIAYDGKADAKRLNEIYQKYSKTK